MDALWVFSFSKERPTSRLRNIAGIRRNVVLTGQDDSQAAAVFFRGQEDNSQGTACAFSFVAMAAYGRDLGARVRIVSVEVMRRGGRAERKGLPKRG